MVPLVSVIIPFYNCPYVDQAIQSVLQQTYARIEIIVVDDGSTQYIDKLAPYMHRIHYLGKSNGGTASALNSGIQMASGTYIAWLSSDDMFYPQKILNQLNFMLSNGSFISYTNYDAMNQFSHIYTKFHGMCVLNELEFCKAFVNGLNPINGCTIMAKKVLFDSAGYFNESLPYTQDYDMWLRLILSGVTFNYLHESLTMYRFHEQMGTVKHHEKILLEYEAVQNKYRSALEQRIRQLKGSPY
ncbi:glycosyltransferase family 2 protein [Paenibacillus alginolyticus]|uniref:Glycosyltransferase n=1 Tax=Paenibacillus alginolyticus TaxID=59839 RepID=A0ABT4GDY2_9BACL|nr:glycosyltransferase [Paenibacillus alginolyticus]MCY9694375.1 glycosyltransferase [Paenibacillus alginolyticus]MEC0147544.1 glycosyltransferase [Paenibacillus alginolyticus]